MATATSTVTSADFAALVPGGTEPPEEIPPEIFQAALATYRERRRLDMRALAADLGIGRATLYRKVGNRDRLLGEVMWYLTRVAMYCSLVSTRQGLRAACGPRLRHLTEIRRACRGQSTAGACLPGRRATLRRTASCRCRWRAA